MGRQYLHIILCLLLVTGGKLTAYSQSGFFVPGTGKIFFTGDSSTIFSDVINRGKFGVGKNATVNFKGKTWENDPQAMITDETDAGNGISGEGGWIRFLSDSIRQQLWGGYNAATNTGASFSRLKIQNRFGVELIMGSTNVRNEINFNEGKFYLHDQIMVVGYKDPGRLSGYDSSRFFVTGNRPNSGILIRKSLRNWHKQVVYPVGTNENAYTPAAIRNMSRNAKDFYVTVFDSVRSSGIDGIALLNESVNKTWQIGKPGTRHLGKIDVALQHLNKDEGSLFNAGRQYSYISQYTMSGWDKGFPESTPEAGYLSSGAPLTGSGVNNRIFANSIFRSGYFSKFSGNGVRSIVTNLWFNAYRLDTGTVKVYWKTKPEINVKTFVVQRRLANETVFTNVASVSSKAVNGYSIVNLNYILNDFNHYHGISFYRLMMVPYTGDISYSDTVAVGNIIGEFSIMLWPNPTPDVFYVSINKTLQAKSIIIWNVLGQKLREEPVNGRNIVQLGGLLPGAYFVSVVLKSGDIIATKKLIVAGR